ncbi:hypothetical protein [Saccharospirillum alexandrii]|uniref:hypothetical protein n=1 Tax=Saccharospirillum alexandrii TaxID=2448477 RepID=UPI003735EC2B
MVEFLRSVPTVIWSVTLGSLITFLGVLVSNRNNRKRLEIQLSHDRELKAIERKVSIRREVYLSAVEELVKANNYLGSLAQVDLTKTNIAEGIQGFFISAAKLGLIAEHETGKALNDLMLAYSALSFRLLAKVSPITNLRVDIDIIDGHYEESQTEIKRIIAAMNNQNESGEPSKAVFEALNKSFEFHINRSKELTEERGQHWDKVNELTREFAIEVAQELKAISLLQTHVMVGIRKELDIETDVEFYKQQTLSSVEKVTKQLDEFISAMDKQD